MSWYLVMLLIYVIKLRVKLIIFISICKYIYLDIQSYVIYKQLLNMRSSSLQKFSTCWYYLILNKDITTSAIFTSFTSSFTNQIRDVIPRNFFLHDSLFKWISILQQCNSIFLTTELILTICII